MNAEDIFLAALDKQTPPERKEYLDHVCGNDGALRAQVDALLRSHHEAGSFLDAPLFESPGTIDQPPAQKPGTPIGPYKLIEQIGEGGMGTVWMAQQSEPVKRLVAVKLIKAGMDSRQVIARFEAERQALALMDHTNIARVLDAGTTSAGRPYFVMDLVRGVPITRYCDEHHLTPRQRLELFIPVCQAIQHAHQKGIIHRDLKPSNVLVAQYDGQPVPKVIDFGVAKATGQSLTDKTLVTGFGNIVGTLEYMSPEQAETNQLDIDTRSDIYSLGVLLYELLTGTTPFSRKELEKAGMLEMLRVIREQEPTKPSTKLSTAEGLPTLAANRGTEPAKLTKLVRGELDWIVMKSLEKDRSRRYESASGFARDIERYLHDEPVQACPPSTAYRFRKFARRNRRALVTASLMVLALLVTVGAVAGSIGWAASDRAARHAAVAREVELALAEAERLIEQEKWPEALDAVKRGKGVMAGGGSDELRDRAEQLQRDVEMMLRLEEVRQQVAELQAGWHEWDAVHNDYAKAFADYGIDVLGLPADEAAARIRARDRLAIPLAGALDMWSCASSPNTATERGRLRAVAAAADPDPWRVRVREAVQRKDGAALAELTRSPDLHRQPRTSVGLLEHGLWRCGHPGLALDFLRKAQRDNPADFWANYWLAHNLFWDPNCDRAEALSFARAAVAVRPKCAGAHLILGLILKELGRFDEAVADLRKAVELAPNNPFAHHDLGWTLHLQGKSDEGVGYIRKAIDLWPENPHAYGFLGHALMARKKPNEAIEAFKMSAKYNPNSTTAHSQLGNALFAEKRYDEAIDAYGRAIALDPNNGALLHKAVRLKPDVAQWQYDLGRFLAQQQKFAEAVAHLEKAVRLDPNLQRAHTWLGLALIRTGKLGEAETVLREATRLDAKDSWALAELGSALQGQKKWAEAIGPLRESLELDPTRTYLHGTLGRVFVQLQMFTEAEAEFRELVRRDPGKAVGYFELGKLLSAQKRYPEAEVELREALRIDPKNRSAPPVLTEALVSQGKLADAKTVLTEAAGREPDNDEPVIRLAEFLRQQKRFAEAEAEICKAIQLNPKRPRTHDMLGSVLREQKKFAEAETAFREAIRLMPELASAHRGLGLALHQQRKFAEAIEPLQEAVRLNPKDDWAYCNLGWALLELRRFPEAEATLRERICNLPTDAGAHYALGRALAEQKKFAEAVEPLREALRLDPTRTTAHGILGRVFIGQEKLPEAEAAFREQIRLSPEVVGGYLGLGKVLNQQKKFAEAEEALRQAIRLDANLAAAHDLLGWALVHQQKYAEAEAAFRELVRLAPKQISAHTALGRSLVDQEKFAEAEAPLREALRLDPEHRPALELLKRALAGEKMGDPAQEAATERPPAAAESSKPAPEEAKP